MKDMFDIIIVGAGISGMTAALYGARAGKKVLLLESSSYGGQIVNSLDVENYPGIKKIDGFTLMKNLYDQVMQYDVVYKDEEVVKVKDLNTVVTGNREYYGKTIIIATGLKNRVLGLYGEKELIGKGISYCATCDGNFYKNKDVAVVGGGNTALEDVLYLSNIVNKVYLILRRSEIRGDALLAGQVKKCSNVEIIYNANIVSLNGEDKLISITLDNDLELNIDGLFIAIGKVPDVARFANIVDIDENGFVISDDTTTKNKNVFVAGDCRTKKLRQLVTAASDGAVAATNAVEYLNNI